MAESGRPLLTYPHTGSLLGIFYLKKMHILNVFIHGAFNMAFWDAFGKFQLILLNAWAWEMRRVVDRKMVDVAGGDF